MEVNPFPGSRRDSTGVAYINVGRKNEGLGVNEKRSFLLAG
jgi:hypothetical protein